MFVKAKIDICFKSCLITRAMSFQVIVNILKVGLFLTPHWRFMWLDAVGSRTFLMISVLVHSFTMGWTLLQLTVQSYLGLDLNMQSVCRKLEMWWLLSITLAHDVKKAMGFELGRMWIPRWGIILFSIIYKYMHCGHGSWSLLRYKSLYSGFWEKGTVVLLAFWWCYISNRKAWILIIDELW